MPLRNISYRRDGRRLEFGMSEVYMGAFKGVFIDREYDCAGRLARPPRRILDLGGNIGFGSVFFANLFPDAHLAIVEPDPRNLPILRQNLAANGVSAAIFEGAIGPSAGRLALRYGANPTCSSLAGTGLHELSGAAEVAVMTVDQVLEQVGWDAVDLVKIDIEGAEEALLTANNAWLRRTGAILIEIHPNTTAERLNRSLARFGFELERVGRGREPVYFSSRRES
jgi:FkbM family methyltransferase